MLRIFIKFGKPLEDDETILIRNKLNMVFEERSSLESIAVRR